MTCKFCNTQIADESKVCSACGKDLTEGAETPVVTEEVKEEATTEVETKEALEAPEVVEKPQPTAAPAPAATAPKAAPSPIVADAVKIIKGVFSKNPMDGAKVGTETTSHAWLLLVGAFILFTGFLRMINIGAVSGFGWFGVTGITLARRFGAFFAGILSSSMFLFAMVAAIMIVFAILKVRMPFARVINLIAASSILYAGTILLAIILPWIGGWVVSTGVVLMYLMIFYSVKTYYDEKVTFLWAFAAVAIMPLMYNLTNAIANIFFGGLISGGFNTFIW